MSALLNKRLARSLWRTKLRLLAVVLMVFVGVFAGITFGGYAHNLDGMYSTMQADDETGSNLADLWVDNRSTTWTAEQTSAFCSALTAAWTTNPPLEANLDSCEARRVVQGALFHTNDTGDHIINSLWHGIPANANADRVWMPDGHSQGRVAQTASEIVIDAHVAEALELDLGDTVNVGAGNASKAYEVVGIGYHPLHVIMAPEGSLFPPEAGQYVVGYLSEEGMARMVGDEVGASNTLLLDVEGTPSFDLPDTEDYEGEEMDAVKTLVEGIMEEVELDGRVRDRGQNEQVEVLRQDLEATKRTTVPFTVMIAVIASITIVLSLQRLVQSQAKEIAVLRTLGVRRSSLMTGYLDRNRCGWVNPRRPLGALGNERYVGFLSGPCGCSHRGPGGSGLGLHHRHRFNDVGGVFLRRFPRLEGKPSRPVGRAERAKRNAGGLILASEIDGVDANNPRPLDSLERTKANSSGHDLPRRWYIADALRIGPDDVSGSSGHDRRRAGRPANLGRTSLRPPRRRGERHRLGYGQRGDLRTVDRTPARLRAGCRRRGPSVQHGGIGFL